MGNAGNLPGKVGGSNATLVSLVDESTGLSADVIGSTPAGTENGIVTRNIPSGTQSVSVPAVAITATVTSVNDAATNQTLLALNAARKGYKLYNDSTVIGYVKEGTTATTSDYSYQIQPLGFYESVGIGCYTGRIDCIWSANGSGAMKVTELA